MWLTPTRRSAASTGPRRVRLARLLRLRAADGDAQVLGREGCTSLPDEVLVLVPVVLDRQRELVSDQAGQRRDDRERLLTAQHLPAYRLQVQRRALRGEGLLDMAGPARELDLGALAQAVH